MGSFVALEPKTYYTSPSQCSDLENHIYCTPTLGRLGKTLLQLSTNITNWEDCLKYETFCKAHFPQLELRRDFFRCYKKLVQIVPFF